MKRIKFFLWILFLLPLPLLRLNASEEKVYTHIHIVDFDHPLSFEEIKSRYTSFDQTDGNLTDKLIFQSDYEKDYKENQLTVKNYTLYVSVTNSKNRTTNLIDEISVRDFTPPNLTLKETEITLDFSKTDIEVALNKLLIIEDNYDTFFENYQYEGIDTLEGAGTYTIHITVADHSGNISNEASILLHLFESIQTEIISTPILLEDKVYTSSELLTLFLQNNPIDTSYLTAQIQTSYLDSPNQQGIYRAEFIFTYENGYQHIYQCKIINNLPDEKKKDDTIIYISLGCIVLLSGIGIIIYRKRR